MKIREIMTLDVETAAPDDTVRTAAQLMADTGAGVLPVCDGNRLVGMVTDRDITVRAVAEGKAPDQCSVRDVMTEDVNYAFEDDDVKRVAQKMGQWQVHRLPVLNQDKRLVGIVFPGRPRARGRGRKESRRRLEEHRSADWETRAMSKHRLPPVPPAGRSTKAPKDIDRRDPGDIVDDADAPPADDAAGEQKNIAVNTTNQGYQQDR